MRDAEEVRELNDLYFGAGDRHYEAPDEEADPGESCEICGEPLRGEIGEFYVFAEPDTTTVVAHVQCGLDRGMEVA